MRILTYPHRRSYREPETYSRRYGAISGPAAAESFMLVRHVQWMRANSHVLGT